MMKFPTKERVGEVKGDQLATRRCYNISMKKISDPTTLPMASVTEVKGEPAEPLEEVIVGEGRVLQIRTCLTLGNPRRPRGLPPLEFGGVHLVP